MVKRQSSTAVGKARQLHVVNEVKTHPHTVYKNKFKMFKDLNIIHDTIKLLEENIG